MPFLLVVVLAQAVPVLDGGALDVAAADGGASDGGVLDEVDGGVADGADAGADEPPVDEPLSAEVVGELDEWWHGDHFTGEWWGARTWLASHGITFDLVYAAELFGTAAPLTNKPALPLNGHLDVAMTLDFEAMGLWKGGKLYLLGQNNHGDGINTVVGSATEISNIESVPYSQLGEFFYEQNLFNVVRFRLGKQDANREFGTPRFGGNFINNNFGMLPSSPLPSYPTNGLGALVVVNPVPWLTLKASLFEGRPQISSLGFDSAFVPNAGHFIISSANVSHKLGRTGKGNGTSTIGFYRQQGRFDEITDNPNPRVFNELWGVFAQHDERIYLNPDDEDDPRCFTIIPRFGWSQPDRFNLSLFLGASVAYHGFGMREDDTVGIGFGYITVNRQLNGTPGPGAEFFAEVFYKWRFTKFMSLQPDIQYYRTPGGDGRDALIVGTRLKFKL